MKKTTLIFAAACFLAVALASCSKKETAATTSGMSVDTTTKAEPVAITDSNHHLYFRPKVGSIERYHVVDRMTMSSSDTPPGGPTGSQGGAQMPTKQSASNTTEIYLRQTVKGIRRDSSVELTFHIDSITMSSQHDTAKTQYSSSNLKDRMNDQFQEFNLLIGKDFSFLTNKYGDLDSITDVASISNTLLATAPDSLRSNPRVLAYAKTQAEELANAYIMRVIVHSPMHALKQDTTWRNASDVNVDITQGLTLPVHVAASETVRGLERRDDHVLAVLEDSTTTTPNKRVFEEGPATLTISQFQALSHSIVRIEDSTGLLYHRAMTEKRNFTLTVESKDHPADKRTITQNGSEELITERLQ